MIYEVAALFVYVFLSCDDSPLSLTGNTSNKTKPSQEQEISQIQIQRQEQKRETPELKAESPISLHSQKETNQNVSNESQ